MIEISTVFESLMRWGVPVLSVETPDPYTYTVVLQNGSLTSIPQRVWQREPSLDIVRKYFPQNGLNKKGQSREPDQAFLKSMSLRRLKNFRRK